MYYYINDLLVLFNLLFVRVYYLSYHTDNYKLGNLPSPVPVEHPKYAGAFIVTITRR